MQKELFKSLVFSFIALFLQLSLSGQPACISFDDIPAKTTFSAADFEAGSVLFTFGEVSVAMGPFTYFDGSTDMWGIGVESTDGIFDPPTGNALWISNTTLTFDFSALQPPITRLSFDYWDGGGEENIVVNGQPVLVLNDFGEAPADIAPGVTLINTTNGDFQGSIVLEGIITSLTIGGQEFFLDNVCYELATACLITNVKATAEDCTPNGIFYVQLDFDHANTNEMGFSVRGNGKDYGDFEYAALPIKLGPLEGDGVTPWEFVVIDNGNENCRDFVDLGPIDCNVAPCSIAALVAEAHEQCNGDGTFKIDLGFQIENGRHTGFDLFVNGEFHSYYEHYPDPFITIPALDKGTGEEILLTVSDNDNPNCAASFSLVTPECHPNDGCHIQEVFAEAHECDANDGFLIDVEFVAENTPSGQFFIFAGDHEFGPFPYGEPFYTVGPMPGNGPELKIKVKDSENFDCYGTFVLQAPDCNPHDNCALFADIQEEFVCDDEGFFMVHFNLEVDNPGSEGFYVGILGHEFGPFPYGEPEYTAGPIKGEGLVADFTLTDKNDPNCHLVTTIVTPNCMGTEVECTIYDIHTEAHQCDEQGHFMVDVAFKAANPNAESFFLFAGDQVFGPLAYGEDFYTIGPFDDKEALLKLLVIDGGGHECFGYANVEAPDCNADDDCKIYNVTAITNDCQDDGSFMVSLNFEFGHVGDDLFKVQGNGINYGWFSYESLPVILGPFKGDGNTPLEFVVFDKSHPECQNYTVLQSPDCEQNVWPGDTDEDNIALNFDLLHIGLAYGVEGLARDNPSTDWQGMKAAPWEKSFADGTNFKHADANGDGLVNVADIDAISHNYGKTHGLVVPYEQPQGTENDPPLFVDMESAGELMAGQAFELPVLLGDANRPVTSIYGLAFTINFDPDMVDVASLAITFPESWFGVSGENALHFSKNLVAEGQIDVAISRINKLNAEGFGTIAIVTGIIEDDILGKMQIEVTDVKAIEFDETPVPLFSHMEEIELVAPTDDSVREGLLQVYPNPADEWIRVINKLNDDIHRVELFNIIGQQILQEDRPGNDFRLDVSDMIPGIYLLKVKYNNTEISKKVTIF